MSGETLFDFAPLEVPRPSSRAVQTPRPLLREDGEWGIQQLIHDRWSFATINGGYATPADAEAALSPGCRVASRWTGEPVGVNANE